MEKILSSPYGKLYENFLAAEARKVSRQGYETLRKQTWQVIKWFEEEEVLLEKATIQDVVRFRNESGERVKHDGTPLCAGTIQNRIKAGRRLFAYLVTTGKRKTNPFYEIPYPKAGEKISRNVLTEAQMGCLLETLRHYDQRKSLRERIHQYRLHVISEFLYATGLRIAEAASLVPDNIDTVSRLVYVPEGKGQKSRTAFLTGYAASVMEQYLTEGRTIVLGKYERTYGHTVFGSYYQRLMTVLNEGLSEVCGRLELPVITSHGFRYSLGTHLLRAGCDMRHIQVILGHEALQTTQVYTRVDTDDLKDSLDRYHPRKVGLHEK